MTSPEPVPGQVASGNQPSGGWDYVYRPRTTPRIAFVVALLVLAGHIAAGVVMRHGSTGVDLKFSDTFALPLLGCIWAGAIALLTRSRVRIGAQGVGVQNLIGERIFGWDEVQGIYFPHNGRVARLGLPMDEHIPVLAIQSNDHERAVEAMKTFRELHERYRND